MMATIFLLTLLFIFGLITTFFNFPRKKFIAWFQSLYLKSPSHAKNSTTSRTAVAENKLKCGSGSITSSNKVELRKIFATFDKNSDGRITKQELKDSLKNIGIFMADKDVAEMVEKVDSNGDGLIDFDEFYVLYESVLGMEGGGDKEDEEEDELEGEEGREKDLKEAFDVFDGDGDGLITGEELKLVLSSLGLQEGKRLEDCKEMIRKVDMDGDGMVNFQEFKKMMKTGGKKLFPVT